MILNQQNVPERATLQECTDGQICTGEMTECVSVLIRSVDGIWYGIHCGGGITGDWPETIVKLFEKTGKTCEKVIAIFGRTYNNECEKKFISYKIEAVQEIQQGLSAKSLKLYCSGSFTLTTSNEAITGTILWSK